MSRSVHFRMRWVVLLFMVLSSGVSAIQPMTTLHAQLLDPLPTSVPFGGGVSRGGEDGSQMGVVSSDQSVSRSSLPSGVPAARGLSQQPSMAVSSSGDVAPSVGSGAVHVPLLPQDGPQTGSLSPFLINIVAKSTARADTDLTYTIYFTNTGSTTYQNVWVQNGIGNDQFYPGCVDVSTCSFTYTGDLVRPSLVSVTGAPNDSSSRQVVWGLGAVAPGQKGSISYTVRVRFDIFPQSGYSPRVLGNTVALYRDGSISTDTKLNEDQWGVVVVGPVFYMTKTGTPSALLEGDRIDYTISVGNATGPNDQPGGQPRPDAIPASQVQVFDIVPSQLENIQPQDGGVYDPSTRRMTWNLPGTLQPGAPPVQLRFSATVKNDLGECTVVVNNLFYVFNPDIPRDPGLNQYYIRGQIDTASLIYAPVYLTVTPSPPSVRVGEDVSWTIDVKSYWRSALSGVTVKFTLPPDFTYLGNTPAPGVGAGVYDPLNKAVSWSNVTLPPQTSFSAPGVLSFVVQSRAGRKIDRNDGIAEVTLPQNVPSGCVRIAFNSAQVEPLIYAVKTVNVTTRVIAGTDVIYTVDVFNMASQALNDVSLMDTLPLLHGRSFVYKSMVQGPAPSVVNGRVLQWYNLSIAAGSVASPAKTTLRFVVTVDGWPNDCADNLVQPDSAVSQARLVGGGLVCIDFPWSIDKVADRTEIGARDTNRRVQFTLTYTSRVSTPQLITPKDFMATTDPTYQFRFVSMVNGPNPLNTVPDIYGRIVWPAVTLGAFATLTYSYQVDMPTIGEVIPSGVYCNRGELWPEPNDQFGYYVYDEACIRVTSIELRVRKDVDRCCVVGLGELVVYTIWLDNRSPDSVSGLVVSDTLPVNMSYVGTAPGSPSPSVTQLPNGQQRLDWSGVAVPGNTAKPLSFKVRVPGLINSTVLNSAEASGGVPAPSLVCERPPAGGGGRCISAVNLDVRNLISIKTDVAPTLAQPNDVISYTLSLVSNNNIPYQDTTITTTLPLGFQYVDTLVGTAPVLVQGRTLVWQTQTVPPQSGPNAGKLSFVFRAQAPSGYGVFRTRVEASSPTGIIPVADTIAPVVITSPTPALSLFATPLVEVGGDVVFRVSLVNPEFSDLTGVTVTHVLPAGFTFAGTDPGTSVPAINGQVLTWSGLTMPAATVDGPSVVELAFHATAPGTAGKYETTVTATATGSRTIDQTFNHADIIVARLSYLYMPLMAK